ENDIKSYSDKMTRLHENMSKNFEFKKPNRRSVEMIVDNRSEISSKSSKTEAQASYRIEKNKIEPNVKQTIDFKELLNSEKTETLNESKFVNLVDINSKNSEQIFIEMGLEEPINIKKNWTETEIVNVRKTIMNELETISANSVTDLTPSKNNDIAFKIELIDPRQTPITTKSRPLPYNLKQKLDGIKYHETAVLEVIDVLRKRNFKISLEKCKPAVEEIDLLKWKKKIIVKMNTLNLKLRSSSEESLEIIAKEPSSETDNEYITYRTEQLKDDDLYDKLRLIEGILYRMYENEEGFYVTQFVLPAQAVKTVINHVHSSIFNAHLGRNKTTAKIMERFYRPFLRQEIKKLVKECEVCQKVQNTTRPHKGELHFLTPCRPNELITVDIAEPFKKTAMQNDIYIRRVTSEYGSAEKTVVKLFNFLKSKIGELDQSTQVKFGSFDYVIVPQTTSLNQNHYVAFVAFKDRSIHREQSNKRYFEVSSDEDKRPETKKQKSFLLDLPKTTIPTIFPKTSKEDNISNEPWTHPIPQNILEELNRKTPEFLEKTSSGKKQTDTKETALGNVVPLIEHKSVQTDANTTENFELKIKVISLELEIESKLCVKRRQTFYA
ncbi:Retrovirus-related Pol poly from transposon, partial [Brachionus plicatilis]